MKWRCALTQRWLPAYLDADLPAFWRRRLKSHLERCPACREELEELAEVVRKVQSAAIPDPEPEFWENFNRELHLKLAQSVPAPPPPRFSKLPYLLGAPALAALLIWIAVGYLHQGPSVLTPSPEMAKQAQVPEKKLAKPRVPAPSPQPPAAVAFVAQNGDDLTPDDDLIGLRGDLDSTLAGMTEKEKESFLKRLRRHEKDGSCLRKTFAIFWA